MKSSVFDIIIDNQLKCNQRMEDHCKKISINLCFKAKGKYFTVN